MRSSSDTPWRSYAGGFVGNGCVGEYHSPGTSPFGDRTLFDRPHRLSGDAIEHVEQRLLRRLRERLDRAAVDGDVDQDRRARDVQVPDAVVHELVVPLALAGREIDGDDAFAEEVLRPDDGRRSSRRSAARRAGTPCSALRRRKSVPTRRRCRCRPTILFPTCRCRTRRAAESCGRSTGACRSSRRSRECSPSRSAGSSATPPGRCAAPTMTVFFATIGVACRPISPVTGSITWSSFSFRSTMPFVPKLVHRIDRSSRRARRAGSRA